MTFRRWLLAGLFSCALLACTNDGEPNGYGGGDEDDGGASDSEFSGVFRSSDGVVIELMDDRALVTAAAASSGLAPGDVYLDRVVRTGEQTWEGRARVVDSRTGAASFETVTITIRGTLQITAGPGSTYTGVSWQSVPPIGAPDGGSPIDAGSMIDSGAVTPVMVTTGSVSFALTNALLTVTASGGLPFTEVGVVVSTQPNPTTASSIKRTSDKTFKGTYSLLVPLEQCVKYYARGYVIEMGGQVTYGNQQEFKVPGLMPDWCSPLRGTWGAPDGQGATFEGSATAFKFLGIPESTSPSSWDNARDKGLIGIGSEYITMIMPNGNGWTCKVLWKSGSSSQGVTAVKYHPCTISISSDERTVTVTSTNSDTLATQSATFVKK